MREFKCLLTIKFLHDKEGNVCDDPPELYPFIEESDWKAFVSSRLTDKFKVNSLLTVLTFNV